jgi:hypothetical protein
MANKLPAFQFYPGDWLKDAGLRSCSPEARGVWIDLLCLMYECPQRGVLRTKTNEKLSKIPLENVSRMIAGCKQKFIRELIGKGVCRVARKDGALYSKRLIRDELHRRHKARAGRKGGQAKPKQTGSKPEANTQAKPGSSSSSSSSTSVNNKKESRGRFTPPTLEDVEKYIAGNPELANIDAGTFWKGFNDGGWIDTRGNPVRNWKLKLRTWSNLNGVHGRTTGGNNQHPKAGRRDASFREQTSQYGEDA